MPSILLFQVKMDIMNFRLTRGIQDIPISSCCCATALAILTILLMNQHLRELTQIGCGNPSLVNC